VVLARAAAIRARKRERERERERETGPNIGWEKERKMAGFCAMKEE